jgi:delta24-sterol reductase
VHDIGKWYGPWFYKHVEKFLEKKGSEEIPKKSHRTSRSPESIEYIPLRSYYHRHTRSLFWEMEDILPFGHHWLFRHTLGWLVRPKVGFFKLTTNGDLHEIYVNKHVDQDLLIPIKSLSRFLDHLDTTVTMYPLWLCPCRILSTPVRGLVNPDADSRTDMYVDVGVYGVPFPARPEGGDHFEPEPSLRKMEALVRELRGFQALYAICYQTRPEFYKMFDHQLYFQLRERYGAVQLLPEIFDKVSVAARGEKSALDHTKFLPHAETSNGTSNGSGRPRSNSKGKAREGSTTPRGHGRRASETALTKR